MRFCLPTLLILFAIPAVAAERQLSLKEAIEVALKRSVQPRISQQAAIAAQSRLNSAWAQVFPKIRAETNVLRWDRRFILPFGTTPVVIRDQITSSTNVSVIQTISGLGVAQQGITMETEDRDAAQSDIQTARLDTVNHTVEAYLRVLQSQEIAKVAQKSFAQMEAQLAQAKMLEQTGAVAHVDVLRMISARDNAKQNFLRAQTGVKIAQQALVLALNLTEDTEITVADDLPVEPVAPNVSEKDAVAAAMQDRPELKSLQLRVSQAKHYTSVFVSQLFPSVMAVLSYQHLEGQGTFTLKDTWYVGATLSWDVWDWGKNYQAVKEARANAERAAIGAEGTRNQIRFDANKQRLEAENVFEMLSIAKSSVEAAEEAHRIQTLRFGTGAATTTDMLEVETDIARARVGLATARYDYYVALANLARAMGQEPNFIQ
jgi:outer membrane protein